MNLEILVEEPSMAAALEQLVPRITGPGVRHRSIVHEGKPDLLNRLPGRLRGYRRWLPPDWRIVVLVDEDRQDCHQLKQQLDQASLDAGFVTRHLGIEPVRVGDTVYPSRLAKQPGRPKLDVRLRARFRQHPCDLSLVHRDAENQLLEDRVARSTIAPRIPRSSRTRIGDEQTAPRRLQMNPAGRPQGRFGVEGRGAG